MEVMKPIWARVGQFMDETVDDDDKKWALVKDNPLNEKFRYYCCKFFFLFFRPLLLFYSCCVLIISILDDAGYVREKHFDGCFLRNTGGPHRDQSHFTLLIYLNEGFDGGIIFKKI
jgi:hypothetical protein